MVLPGFTSGREKFQQLYHGKDYSSYEDFMSQVLGVTVKGDDLYIPNTTEGHIKFYEGLE